MSKQEAKVKIEASNYAIVDVLNNFDPPRFNGDYIFIRIDEGLDWCACASLTREQAIRLVESLNQLIEGSNVKGESSTV